MKSFFDNLVFFIFVSTSRSKDDRKGIFSTVFLITFSEILLLLPIIIYIMQKLNLNLVSSYLKFPIFLRYGIILLIYIVFFRLNYMMLNKGNYILNISEKLDSKREKYYSFRWLLIICGSLLSLITILLLRAIKIGGFTNLINNI